MTSTGAILRRAGRCCLAAALALSWLLLTGLPASAGVTRVYVETPEPDAVLTARTPLVVMVDRTALPEEDKVEIQTRLLDAEDKPVSKKVLPLPFDRALRPRDDQPGQSDRLRFKGAVDPYSLAWMPRALLVAPNAEYHLQYREILTYGDTVREGDWKTHRFWLNAPPPQTGQPGARVANPEAKRMDVAWHPNPAPDLVSYTVQRRRDGGEWEVARAEIKPDVTQITDTVSKYGTYRYRVVAFRPASTPPKQDPPPTEGEGEVDSAQATEEPKEGEEDKEPVELRFSTSPPSEQVVLAPPGAPTPSEDSDDGSTDGTGDDEGSSAGFGGGTGTVPSVPGGTSSSGQTSTQPFNPQTPDISAPPGFEDTYKGPLSYGVEPKTVTERVPIEVAEGGSPDETLTVLNRAIDQQRVLPPVAGGLILVVSAAHVLRYLNE